MTLNKKDYFREREAKMPISKARNELAGVDFQIMELMQLFFTYKIIFAIFYDYFYWDGKAKRRTNGNAAHAVLMKRVSFPRSPDIILADIYTRFIVSEFRGFVMIRKSLYTRILQDAV